MQLGEEIGRTCLVVVFLEPGKVDNLKHSHRIEEHEGDKPESLLVARRVPEAKRFKSQRPDTYKEEQDKKKGRVKGERAAGGAEEGVLKEGAPHI